MRLLIDGYNLLHATDVAGEGRLAGTLRGARDALLDHLAAGLPERLRTKTCLVFDAADAPPGLADRVAVHSMTVVYARGYPDADSLIEELIEACVAPKELLVVSSDRRVQRAARRCGAGWTDSGVWRRTLVRRQRAGAAASVEAAKPPRRAAADEAAFWVEHVGDPATLELPPLRRLPPSIASRPPDTKPTDASAEEPPFFPPGYADDLAEEFRRTGFGSGPPGRG